MNIVDSSGWLEYFADDSNSEFFKEPIENTEELLVTTINLYEVFKVVLQQRGLDEALQTVAYMQQGIIIDLSSELAINAAVISAKNGLPMADSMILAAARYHDATLWTQDADFKNIEGVHYIEKKTTKSTND